MDARDRHVTERARAVAAEFGLEMLDVDQFDTITPAEWRAWAALPATRRLIGTMAEGLAVAAEAAEVAQTKRTHMGGLRPQTRNDLAQEMVLGRHTAEVYRKLLAGIGTQANRQG